jgi:hypothetical protein
MPTIDRETNVAKTISFEHGKVHDKEMFTLSDYDSDVDIASPKYWHIKTASGYELHLVCAISASGSCLIELYEDPTFSGAGASDGTSKTTYNNYRGATNTLNASFYYDADIGATGSDGTAICTEYIPGTDRGQMRVGGEARTGSEWVLKADTSYLFKVTPGADDTILNFVAECYELAE